MRHLIRPRRDRRALESIELAVVAERLALPGLPDDLERLAKARLTLAVGDSVDVIRARDAAAADPELQAAPADVIERRPLFRNEPGVVQGEPRSGRAHPKAPSPGRG